MFLTGLGAADLIGGYGISVEKTIAFSIAKFQLPDAYLIADAPPINSLRKVQVMDRREFGKLSLGTMVAAGGAAPVTPALAQDTPPPRSA